MKIMNWTEVEPASSGGSTKLPAGAYVLRIEQVSEHTSRTGSPYLTFVFDVAEGEHEGNYADEDRDYVHSFNRSYEGKAAPFFRALLDAFEACNPGRFSVEGWQRTCDAHAFAGLLVGAMFRDRSYTNGSGKDVTVLDFVRPMTLEEVRGGKWSVPPAKDDRDAAPGGGYAEDPYGVRGGQAPAADPYSADVPF